MYPILFDHNRFDLNSHGIGDLVETMECTAQCTDEGEYEMQFKYPMNGELFSELKVNRFVVAKTDPHPARDSALQAFRIYNIEKNLDGTVTVSCQHVSYDLSCYIVKPFKLTYEQSEWAYAALHKMSRKTSDTDIPEWQNYMVLPYPWNTSPDGHPFTFSSNVGGWPHMQDKIFKFDEPRSARSLLLDGDDSIRGAWGGDLVFDNYKVYLLRPATNPPGDVDDANKYNGGFDRNVTLEYGVDITDLTFEEDISEMITGILPYWRGSKNTGNEGNTESNYSGYDYSGGGGSGSSDWHIRDSGKAVSSNEDDEIFVYGEVCYITGEIQKHTIEPVDLSEFFQDHIPSNEELKAKGYEYINANSIGEPEVTATVSYANLGQPLYLHDAVTIRHPDLGIDIKAKVTSYTYDVLAEQITEIEISNVKYRSKWKGLEDASRLKRGLIAPSRIASNSITGDKLTSGSVGSSQISTGAVGGWHLRSEAVSSDKIEDGAVTGETTDPTTGQYKPGKIATDAVTVNTIRQGAVHKEKIPDYELPMGKMLREIQTAWDELLVAKAIVANYVNVNVAAAYVLNATQIKATQLKVFGPSEFWTYGGKNVFWTDGTSGYVGIEGTLTYGGKIISIDSNGFLKGT